MRIASGSSSSSTCVLTIVALSVTRTNRYKSRTHLFDPHTKVHSSSSSMTMEDTSAALPVVLVSAFRGGASLCITFPLFVRYHNAPAESTEDDARAKTRLWRDPFRALVVCENLRLA